MAKYKILALDLDGTLLNKESMLPEENKIAVRQAQQAGVQIVLCTGRNPIEAKMFSDKLLAPADWLITANGAYICKPDLTQNIFAEYLSNDDCRLLLDICKEYDTDPCLYDDSQLYYGNAFKRFCRELNIRRNMNAKTERSHSTFIGTDEEWEKLLQTNQKPFIKSILYHDNPKSVDKIIEKLESTGRFELAPSVLFGGLMKNVEINCKGVHKGNGLKKLTEHLGFTMNDVMALGDSDNDLTMLEMSGLGIAMGNAEEYIKEIADECTLTNIEFGVAHSIKQHLL